jgi:hypothetical protein
MTIKTHADLKAAADQTLQLASDLAYVRTQFPYCVGVEARVSSIWRRLCHSLDEVVAVAGGHRDYLTWHLFGATITAEDLWGKATDLQAFLFSQAGSSAHLQMAIASFWAIPQPLPERTDTKTYSLPAQGGTATEADTKARTWIDAFDGDTYDRENAATKVQDYLAKRGTR